MGKKKDLSCLGIKEIDDFLSSAYIRQDDTHTINIIKKFNIYHWTFFQDLSQYEIEELGFKKGPAQLIFKALSRSKTVHSVFN